MPDIGRQYGPGPRAGDENANRDLRQVGSVPSDRDQPVRVPVQMQLLRELRLSQAALERYVQVSFESQTRLTDTFKSLSWLSESAARPEKLESEDYWLRGKDALDRVEGLAGFLERYGLAEEIAFAQWATGFDRSLGASVTLLEGILDRSLGDDMRSHADSLIREVRSMNEACSRLLRLCEQEAKQVIVKISDELNRIFDRIESDRLDMLAQQPEPIQSTEFGQFERPERTVNPVTEPYVGKRAKEASANESLSHDDQTRERFEPVISPF